MTEERVAMANYRKNRINEEVQRELCEILREVKDPRIQRAFVSVTAVDVSADLKFAKVFYSTLGIGLPDNGKRV